MPKLSSELQGQILSFMIDCVNVEFGGGIDG